jgi:putative ATP-dependent endonuclease of OLD family
VHIAKLEIENFRIFGAKADAKHLSLELSAGLNLIVGENDSGKTCVVDALRLVLGTAPAEYFPLTSDDFHCHNNNRASVLSITVELVDLTAAEAAAFLEYLELEQHGALTRYRLRVTLSAQRDESLTRSPRRPPVKWELRAGPGNDGQRFDGPVRELLRATYLKPLRDAVGELTARKGSRLSQILYSYPQLRGQEVDDWNPHEAECSPVTLIGIARRAEHTIRSSDVVRDAEAKLNEAYLKPFSIGPRPLSGRIGIPAQELRQLLERMELTLADHEPGATRGLGHHNILFMAAELLALDRNDDPCLPLVLIEEPEAHLHPHLQLRLVEFFRSETDGGRLQVILTSHSPNVASKIGLRDITLMHAGRAFPLRPHATKLDASDYEFLERFLDVTRAELLFARGLLIVEGDAEAILLPTIAELIGCPLPANGVSVVSVGSVGLFRYSRILQRADGSQIPVRVACVADRDIPPDEAKAELREGRKTVGDFEQAEIDSVVEGLKSGDGGAVRTFVSDLWTLEYDLAFKGLSREVHAAVTLAAKSKSVRRALSPEEYRACLRKAFREHRVWTRESKSTAAIATMTYQPFLKDRASKTEAAQYLAKLLRRLAGDKGFDLRSRLPAYLVGAIKYATCMDPVVEQGEGVVATAGAENAAT